MRIGAYFVNSFLFHALLLIYLLSLPLHRPPFEFGAHGTYFVSIKSGAEMPAKISSPTYNIKKSKPEIHSTLKFTKSALITKETDVSKETIDLQAKKETVSEKDTELKEKEVPEEKPAQVAELKETPKEEPIAVEKKEEVAKKEDVEPVQVAK